MCCNVLPEMKNHILHFQGSLCSVMCEVSMHWDASEACHGYRAYPDGMGKGRATLLAV